MDDFNMPCPRCEGGDIGVEIVSYSEGRPATRLDPPEPPEVEWKITSSCEGCGLRQDLLEDGSLDDEEENKILDAITEAAFEHLDAKYQADADARADAEYEEWKDRELFGEDYPEMGSRDP